MTPEQTEMMVKLYNERWTFGQIAERIGTTRSSVAGKISRMKKIGLIEHNGYIKPISSIRRHARARPSPPVASAVAPATTHGSGRVASPAVAEIPRARPTHETYGPVSFWDARPNHCRWIVSNDNEDLMFCGEMIEKRSYCLGHANIAYVPPKKR